MGGAAEQRENEKERERKREMEKEIETRWRIGREREHVVALHIGSTAFTRWSLEDPSFFSRTRKSPRNQHPPILKRGSSDCNCFSPAFRRSRTWKLSQPRVIRFIVGRS